MCGTILQVFRCERTEFDAVMQSINATGYGLALGVGTRIDETIGFVVDNANVRDVYASRNIVGAVLLN